MPRPTATSHPLHRSLLHRSLLGRVIAAVLLAVALAAAGLPGLTSRASAASFTVYTDERDANPVDLAQYGAVKATVAYDAFALTCDSSGCYANGGALPTQSAFEADIRTYVGEFGGSASSPIVLDYENIVLAALSGQAADNAFTLWKQLITWTHDAEPSAPVGMYGYDWETANNSLTQQLHQNGLLDFFAPRAYSYSTQTAAAWTSTLDSAVSNDRSLASDQPIYPYVNPAYQDTGGYLSGSAFSSEISQIQALTTGVVVWEATASGASACGWLDDFSYAMGQLTGTGSSGPLTVTAQVPNTCVLPRGATTGIPLTITNDSASTSSATTISSFSGPSGITGSYSYWDVPALAPGASWTTTLTVTVASTQVDATALLTIDYGSGTQRLCVVVT